MKRSAVWAASIDLAAIVLFVAIGRNNHREAGNQVLGAAKVAAPFLIAAAAAWVGGRLWRDPMSVATGLTVWLVTVALGMVLRRVVFDRGTATAFVIVATVMLFALFIGWRGLWRWRADRPPG